MKRLTAITAFIIYLVFCQSCSSVSDFRAVLNDVESYIDDRPDSALAVLRAMDPGSFSDKKARAEYALLHSIALDKNYIDLTTDSIIAPAVEYYRRRGDVESRFKCHYYQARIHENSGDIDNALLCAAKAEALDTSKVSADMLCMLYGMKGMIYHNAWRNHESVDAYLTARRYALISEKYNRYIFYSLALSDSYRYIGDYQAAWRCLEDAHGYHNYFSLYDEHSFAVSMMIKMEYEDVPPQKCLQYVEQYISSYPQEEMISWRHVACVYLRAGQPDTAYDRMALHAKYNDVSGDPSYYGVLSDIMAALGRYKEALSAHQQFVNLMKSQDVAIHLSDVKLVEERYNSNIQILHAKYSAVILICIIVILLMAATYFVLKYRTQALRRSDDIAEIQREYEDLQSLYDTISKGYDCKVDECEKVGNAYRYLSEQCPDDIEEGLLEILSYRIKALSSFIQQPTPDSLSKVDFNIKELKKNKSFIVDNIGILYAINYPKFIAELKSAGLTASEIGFCCLYLLGLNISEAGTVVGKATSVYNVNRDIRKKLNIQHEKQYLNKWLIMRFQELYPNSHD